MKNYMVTTDDENVVVFCEDDLDLGLANVEAWARKAGLPVTDAYEVRDDELQYYLYSPLWVISRLNYYRVLEFIKKN